MEYNEKALYDGTVKLLMPAHDFIFPKFKFNEVGVANF